MTKKLQKLQHEMLSERHQAKSRAGVPGDGVYRQPGSGAFSLRQTVTLEGSVVKALQEHYPDVEVATLCRKALKDLLAVTIKASIPPKPRKKK